MSEKISSQRHGFLVSAEVSDSGHEGKAQEFGIPPGTISTRAGNAREGKRPTITTKIRFAPSSSTEVLVLIDAEAKDG